MRRSKLTGVAAVALVALAGGAARAQHYTSVPVCNGRIHVWSASHRLAMKR